MCDEYSLKCVLNPLVLSVQIKQLSQLPAPVPEHKRRPLTTHVLRWKETWLQAQKNDWQGWYSSPQIKDQQCHVLFPKISSNTNLGLQSPRAKGVNCVLPCYTTPTVSAAAAACDQCQRTGLAADSGLSCPRSPGCCGCVRSVNLELCSGSKCGWQRCEITAATMAKYLLLMKQNLRKKGGDSWRSQTQGHNNKTSSAQMK